MLLSRCSSPCRAAGAASSHSPAITSSTTMSSSEYNSYILKVHLHRTKAKEKRIFFFDSVIFL